MVFMHRIFHHLAPASDRPGGLALPTITAAAVCGGSVLAIAVTASLALDGGGRVAVDALPSGPIVVNGLGARSPLDSPPRAMAHQEAGGERPVDAGVPAPVTAATSVPRAAPAPASPTVIPVAATGDTHSIVVSVP
jgi:hypothetical protein